MTIDPGTSCRELAKHAHFHAHTAITGSSGKAGAIILRGHTIKNNTIQCQDQGHDQGHDQRHEQQQTEFGPFAAVVWAHAAAAETAQPPLIATLADFPYRFAKGHVLHVDAAMNQAWAGERYLLPSAGNNTVIGTDYRARQRDTAVDPTIAEWLDEAVVRQHFSVKPQVISTRAAVRCTTPDHLPLVGALLNREQALPHLQHWRHGQHRNATDAVLPVASHQDGHFVTLAHGSRGLSGACYAAQMLAATLCGLLPPTPQSDVQAVLPDRYWLRRLRQGK